MTPILTLLFFGAAPGNRGQVITAIRRVKTVVEPTRCAAWCPVCQREPELRLG